MEFVSCRIRGNTIPNFNIEELIKSIENHCDIDMNSPQWRDIITRIQAAVIDNRRRVKDHKLRNSLIAEKLHKEFSYISPFYLTDVMARTARKWERLKTLRANKLDPLLPESTGSISSRNIDPEIKEEEIPEITVDDDDMKKVTLESPLTSISSKPTNGSMSPIGPEIYKEIINDIVTMVTEKTKTEEPVCTPTPHLFLNAIIKRSPKTMKIYSSQEHTLELKLKNCTNHLALIQYQSLIGISQFNRISVFPATIVKLVPGISYTFKIFFKLVLQEEFTSQIKFHVKYPANSMTHAPKSYYEYYVPIICQPDKKLKHRSVTAPEIIVIPPVYSWQVKNKSEFYEYPFANADISVDTNDTHSYYVRIVKREVDIASEDADETNASNEVNITTPTSVIKNIDDDFKDSSLSKVLENASVTLNEDIKSGDSSRKGKSASSKKSLKYKATTSNLNILNVVLQLIVNVVERAMDVFVFDKTYLFLKSGETKRVRVSFTQVLHIGCHNCYYDFKFYDSESNELIFTKITRVFADIMPHPIQITPDTLDMTDTPIIFGRCINSFVITNTHCLYPVNIRIVTSANMKKLIKITPMKTVVLQKGSAKFVVNLCTSNWNPLIEKFAADDLVSEDNLFVMFTFKIVISGYATAYKNITPIYYDVIAPSIHEYEYVYQKKCSEARPNHSN